MPDTSMDELLLILLRSRGALPNEKAGKRSSGAASQHPTPEVYPGSERIGKRERASEMKRVITNAIAIAAVAGAVVLFGTSVKDLATWKISGLDSAFLLNASIIG